MKDNHFSSNRSRMPIMFHVVMFALMSAACGGTEAPLTVPDGAQAGELVSLEPCVYEQGDVTYNADCGTLVVPENRSKPQSRLIALPVTRVHALGNSPSEPIFWLEGGPGNSNMQSPGVNGLIDNHDIVMVGYRGRDGSVVLQCPELGKAITGLGDDLLSHASTANFGSAIRTCAARLEGDGIDLEGYSIPEVVEDMETARRALGLERINLLSGSYGTRVAMIYAWMHPDSLHRSVMINVNPPGHFAWEPEALDAQFSHDAELCARDAACSARTNDLAATVQTVSSNLPERWLVIPVDAGKVQFLTHFMLFNRGTAATIFDAYMAAEDGDPSGLALISFAADFMLPSMTTWGHWAAFGSIDYDPARDWITDMNPPDSILGSPFSLLIGAAVQQSGGWPVAPMPDEYRRVQPSDVETLLVSGSCDYSTPPQAAEDELLPALAHGNHVILSEFGHFPDVWGFQPEARRHLLSTFYATGEVDASRFVYQPMDFEVGLGFPVIAKIALAVVVFIAAGLAWLVYKILRRIVRHKAA